MPGETDRELVARAVRGGARAFRALMERHHATAHAVVRGVMGETADAEDVLQRVYLKVYRGLAGFRGEARLSTWIFRIARNEALNAVESRGPDQRPLESVEGRVAGASSPERDLERKELHERVGRALSRLAPKDRLPLELHYMGERSYAEIAEMTGLPLGTVKTRIRRAKVELRRILKREELIPSTGRHKAT